MVYLGIDLGKRRDHTAIAIVETARDKLLVRYLERVSLGTPYTAVVARVAEIVRQIGECAVVVDGTGVGEPVVDTMRRAGLGCGITAVTITSGERQSGSGARYSVPKQDLIAVLEIALEKRRLRVARTLKEAGALAREMINIQMTPGAGSGRARIGADGYGEHDDLVMALALACWRAQRPQNHFGEGRLPGF